MPEFLSPGSKDLGIANKLNRSQAAEQLEKRLPPQEDRNGLMLNVIRPKQEKVKGEISQEELEGFLEIMHARIQEQVNREKTTLPKEKLGLLDEELRLNPGAAKTIIEAFGYDVASDPFMLYGLIAKGNDLARVAIHYYREVVPATYPRGFGLPGPKDITEASDQELLKHLKEFWKGDFSDPQHRYSRDEFPYGDDIHYYAGRDVKIDDENNRFLAEQAPAYRYIFGPSRKNKTDYASSMAIYPGKGKFITANDVQEFSNSRYGQIDKIFDYALYAHRGFEDAVGQESVEIVEGYPAEWYLPAASKPKVLNEYFTRYVIPRIRKTSGQKGIR